MVRSGMAFPPFDAEQLQRMVVVGGVMALATPDAVSQALVLWQCGWSLESLLQSAARPAVEAACAGLPARHPPLCSLVLSPGQLAARCLYLSQSTSPALSTILEQLKSVFSLAGAILNCQLTPPGTGFAFVTFSSAAEAGGQAPCTALASRCRLVPRPQSVDCQPAAAAAHVTQLPLARGCCALHRSCVCSSHIVLLTLQPMR